MNTRLTADERRTEVIAAATAEFARGGFAGTSTEAIATRAGVSQPYLFQLFGTKKDLFLAAVRDCFAHTYRHFEPVARSARDQGLGSEGILEAMGKSYHDLLRADRDRLRLQLHAYAACSDPDVQKTVREEFLGLWGRIARLADTRPEVLMDWFAMGMLINVVAAMDAAGSFEEFCAVLQGGAVPVA